MISVQSENVNSHMQIPPVNVGVISPPNKLPSEPVYSHEEATRNFSKIDQDVYVAMKKALPQNDKQTPKSVWAALGIAGAGTLLVLAKLGKK